MSIWIWAVCTESIGKLADYDLREELRTAPFEQWGEGTKHTAEECRAMKAALRFEHDGDVMRMHYRLDDPAYFVRIERWTGEAMKEELGEFLEWLDDSEIGQYIRSICETAVETIAFELKVSDVESLGQPISFNLAMWLAHRGAGLVRTDNGDWWDPDEYELVFASD